MPRVSAALAAVVVLVHTLLAGCAASDATIRKAKAARYPEAAFEEVFRASREAMIAKGYPVHKEDAVGGVLYGDLVFIPVFDQQWRHTRKYTLIMAVALHRLGDGTFEVVVGSEYAGRPSTPDDPPEVEGRRDGLAVEIYQRVGHLAIAR